LTTDQILTSAAATLITQQGQISDLEKQQQEDHGIKHQIRDLLTQIDSRIVSAVDRGHREIVFRAVVEDCSKLENFALSPDGRSLIRVLILRPVTGDAINNGSFGTTSAAENRIVVIEALPLLRAGG